ncbi:MAG: CCA tRNA nucleotidyltransferase [Candidatus Parcubacteria bacterium]|nr:CCA tRNA nucleotidyltransferase [Candidatus Parcubacteria bacterium]
MSIPIEVRKIVSILENKGFQAFVVGGCVRDLLLGVEPNDWDIATNANPKELEKIFPKSFNVNKFGTVTVLTSSKKENLKEIEITTFRTEEKYTDKRHPDKVKWAKTIKEDLSRRDFTVNAIALKIKNDEIIDPFEGQKDLKDKLIRAVGKPEERFQEDSLRLMRAVRFATSLSFNIEEKTLSAVRKNAGLLKFISKERIRDEFIKIVMSDDPSKGIELLRETELLKHIVPELIEGYQVGQNKHHIYEVYEHSIIFHDSGKPRVKEGQGADSTFYNHEIVGAKMTAKILENLKFPKKDIEKIVKLVRYHLFYYNIGEVQESSVRRLLARVGAENFEELVQLRMCDRIGSGCPKAMPYKLRHFQFVAEKVALDPINATALKIGGDDIMKVLKIEPGPKVGKILDILLGEILDEPKNNKKVYLNKRLKELSKFDDKKIEQMAKIAKSRKEEIVTKREEMTKKKYWVS